MQLFYRLLADLIVVVHFVYVSFVILGLLLTLIGALRKWQWVRNFTFRILHLFAILLVVGEVWLGFTCPLTTWEHRLRELAGQTVYEGAFLANFVHETLFYEAPDWVFIAGYTGFGGLVLFTFLLIPPRWPFRRQPRASS